MDLAALPSVEEQLGALAGVVRLGGVMVLSGAGLSTESGIPDYRGPLGIRRKAAPMQYRDFVGDAEGRRRYWARSYLGWRVMREAAPNDGHRAVAALQRLGLLSGIVTQNVDGLHQAAGATDVLELHGGLDRVICLGCRAVTPRGELDTRLVEANPGWRERILGHVGSVGAGENPEVNPDGDVELDDAFVASFVVVDCADCGGLLKPDVVFFGETVPPERVTRTSALVAASAALLVLGSSLTVMSGRRFVIAAGRLGVPVLLVNQGPTRSDDVATLKVEAPLGPTLTALVDRLA